MALLITTSLCKTDYDSLNEEDAVQQEQIAEPTAGNMNVGMMVMLPTEPGEKVTVFDIFFAKLTGEILCTVSGDFLLFCFQQRISAAAILKILEVRLEIGDL